MQKGPILILKYKCDYIQDCTFKICSKSGEYNDEYIADLKFILHLFQSASCLNFNLNKSTISPINVDSSMVDYIAENWGIKK